MDSADLGNIFLHLSLILIFFSIYRSLIYDKEKNQFWLHCIILSCIAFSLLCLVHCFITSDFTVLSVVNNSNLHKPLIYKVGAAWGHHEGSMLLWILSLSSFTCAFIGYGYRNANTVDLIKFINITATIQSLIIGFFLTFTIYTSNPFHRIFPAPIDGYGLNPILQDIGLTLHPPMLYLGYVGFSIVYSGAIAGIITNFIGQQWAKILRPWLILSWIFLTLGISLGSWWAYRELGWGGFWFWDPVENVALMPWIIGLALIHSFAESAKYSYNLHWSVLLSILSFTFSMIGTFIVRSGLITSVHSFALVPERGIWILLFICISTGISLLLYAFKPPASITIASFKMRHILLWFNHLIAIIFTFSIAFGTLYPSFIEIISGEMVSIGPAYYNSLLKIFIIPFLIICTLSSSGINTYTLLGVKKFWVRQRISIYLSIIITFILAKVFTLAMSWELLIIIGSIWLFLVIILQIIENRPKASSKVWGILLGHLGFAIAVFVISFNSLSDIQTERKFRINEEYRVLDIIMRIDDVYFYKTSNYIGQVIKLHLVDLNAELYPEIRFFPLNMQQTSESAILHTIFYDIYVVATEIREDEVLLRIHRKPLIGFLWMSAMIIIFGGMTALVGSLYDNNRKK